MGYALRFLVNCRLERTETGGLRIAAEKLKDDVPIAGELSQLQTFNMALEWREGSVDQRSTVSHALLSLSRRLNGTGSDVLPDRWQAGEHEGGDAYVVPARLYEIDNTRAGWDGVVNEWQFGRTIVTSHSEESKDLLQTLRVVATDLQLIAHRGTRPPAPDSPLGDPLFRAD